MKNQTEWSEQIEPILAELTKTSQKLDRFEAKLFREMHDFRIEVRERLDAFAVDFEERLTAYRAQMKRLDSSGSH